MLAAHHILIAGADKRVAQRVQHAALQSPVSGGDVPLGDREADVLSISVLLDFVLQVLGTAVCVIGMAESTKTFVQVGFQSCE